MRWMEGRKWTPVTFTPELALWTEKADAVVSAEKIRESNGATLIRITARKHAGGLTAMLTIDVDPQTWRPKRQSIRFESGDRVVELRLTSSLIRAMLSSDLSPALFIPDIPHAAEAARTPGVDSRSVGAPLEEHRPPDAAGGEAVASVEARYILHEVGACMGEPVRIEEQDGGVRVWNLGGKSGSWPQAFTTQAGMQDVAGALADLRRISPVQIDETDNRVPEIALRNAWALRNLVADFPAGHVAGLPERSWHQLESMMHAHMSALRNDLGAALPSSRGSFRSTGAKTSNWRESTIELFDLLLRVRDEPNSIPVSFENLDSKLDEIAIGFAAESERNHALTAFARSKIADALLAAGDHEDRGFSYRYEGDTVEVSDSTKTARAKLVWAFGDGVQGTTPVGYLNGDYFEYRFSWYRKFDHASTSPGHPQRIDSIYFALGLFESPSDAVRCFNCHATGVAVDRLGKPDLAQMVPGVTCERCHGNGTKHASAAKNGSSADKVRQAIFNPGRLPAKPMVEVCGECHRSPLPGNTLSEPEKLDPAAVRFQPVGLLASKCFQASRRLSCLTCHDPHSDAVRDAAYYKAKCLGCHAARSSPSLFCGRSRQENCLPCHMRAAQPFAGLSFTDHRIRIY